MPWTYTTTHNGAFLTITAPDGRTCFLQGDEAATLCDRLTLIESDTERSDAEIDEVVQMELSAYDSVCA